MDNGSYEIYLQLKNNMRRYIYKYLQIVLLAISLIFSTGCIRKDNNPDEEQEATLDHLIIEEVFYVGTHLKDTKAGKMIITQKYNDADDRYIKIYNPTKEVKYLDGLGLATSVLNPTQPLSFENRDDLEYKDKVLGAAYVAQFPGSGQEHPIKPGESILVAAQAINNKAGGKNLDWEMEIEVPEKALDLSSATFQWKPKSTWDEDYAYKEVGNARDLKILYHYRGENTFTVKNYTMLALVDLSKEGRAEQVADPEKTWKFTAKSQNDKHTHTTSYICAQIPVDWIIDAVSMAPLANAAWSVTSTKVDAGHANTLFESKADTSLTKEEFSKAIRRKHNGRHFEDSNDSTMDFEATTPSMLK